jgi:hypothetical protein
MSINNHPVENEEIMAYLDGELPPERAAEAASHLERCPQCKQLVADLQEVSQTMMAWQVEGSELEPSEELVQAMEKPASRKTAVIHHGSWRSLLSPRSWPKPVWGLAAVGLIAVVLVTPSLVRSRQAPFKSFMEQQVARSQARAESATENNDSEAFRIVENAHQNNSGLVGKFQNGGTLGKLEKTTPRPGAVMNRRLMSDEQQDEVEESDQEPSNVSAANGPMIIRTAELQVTTKEFDNARSSVEQILKRRHGYVGELNVNTTPGAARSLSGTLRVPAVQLDAMLSDLKSLGTTDKESQGGEEVTQQYVDLQARLANAKHTEQRLTDILRERTGKLSDVLAVETQISRVRGEIEQMEAQRKSMKNQVDLATLTLTVIEEYKAKLDAVPPSTSTQFRNAAVEGYRALVDGIIAVLLWLLSTGPTLLVWIAILFLPLRMIWRRLRPRFAQEIEVKAS